MSLPECTVNTNNIQNLPDWPTLPANELKQEFDKSGKDLKDYLNDILVPAVEKLVRDEKANLETSINNKILADNKKRYHIGKIIFSAENVNPSTYLGFGTWELWGSGKVPVGVDSTDEDFNTVEKTGGEKKHKLTIEEMPKHAHTSKAASPGGPSGFGDGFIALSNSYTQDPNFSTAVNGGDQLHNNLQPYITCYMWKRTA